MRIPRMNRDDHVRVSDTLVVAEDTHAVAVEGGVLGDGLDGERVRVDLPAVFRRHLGAGVGREGRPLGLVQRLVGPVAGLAALVLGQVCREHAVSVN